VKTETEKKKRFAFEPVDKALADFASEMRSERPSFYRAWRKFRGVLQVYAQVDFLSEGLTDDKEQAISWAWEDAEVAFRGHGEHAMTGAISQMWDMLSYSTKHTKRLKLLLTAAFREAEASTPKGTKRRYLVDYRKTPIRTLEEGLDEPAVTPTFGPVLREFVFEEGGELEVDGHIIGGGPDEAEAFYDQLEALERDIVESEVQLKKQERKTALEDKAKQARARLQVIPGRIGADEDDDPDPDLDN
jgi:hypothetical protein